MAYEPEDDDTKHVDELELKQGLTEEDRLLLSSERRLALFMAEHEEVWWPQIKVCVCVCRLVIQLLVQILAAADESAALREAGDIIMSTYASDPIRLNFELLFLCKSIVNSHGTPEDWDLVAEKVISRVKSTVRSEDTSFCTEITKNNEIPRQDMSQPPSTSTASRDAGGRMTSHTQRFKNREHMNEDGWISRLFSLFIAPAISVQRSKLPEKNARLVNPELVTQLVGLGFSHADSEAALLQANNDEAAAIAHLTTPKASTVDSALKAQLVGLGFSERQVGDRLVSVKLSGPISRASH